MVTGRPEAAFTWSRMRRPASSPTPRNESRLERLALSNDALNTAGSPWRSAIAATPSAHASASSRLSSTLRPEISRRGEPPPTVMSRIRMGWPSGALWTAGGTALWIARLARDGYRADATRSVNSRRAPSRSAGESISRHHSPRTLAVSTARGLRDLVHHREIPLAHRLGPAHGLLERRREQLRPGAPEREQPDRLTADHRARQPLVDRQQAPARIERDLHVVVVVASACDRSRA